MKKSWLILFVIIAIVLNACNKDDFSENYTDPSKISESTVDKQYAGFLVSNREYVLPAYRNYFVVLRTTLSRYTQAVGWVNSDNQYVPGAAGSDERWKNFYASLAQYREMEKIYDKLSADEQADYRIFMITGTIYLYDHLQRVVDLHGDIPFTEAGRLSQNGGDYIASLPGYDTADSIYTTMLDDLKSFSDELNTINLKDGISTILKKQDFINYGDLNTWKEYCNSLRLRMLTRVSKAPAFQARALSEITSILSNSGAYPVVGANANNVQINVNDLGSDLNSKGFRTGLEDWDGNLASKAIIDHMVDNADPRLRAMFEPGEDAEGVYLGVDPLLLGNEQTELVATGTVSRYNRSTLSRNEYFPGVLMTASEVSLIKAEAYLEAGNDAMAKTSYEDAIASSVEFYYNLRDLSNDPDTSGALVPTNDTEIQAYINSADVKWVNATTKAEKIALIATQKWIHFSVVQLNDSWAELRRLDAPNFSFKIDNANTQQLPPKRWLYPTSEVTNNSENYQKVSGSDNLNAKLFWDLN